MSLPSLIGGADCGPVNPLAQLSKRLGGEGGASGSQWDRQVGPSGSSSPSQSTFRSRNQNHNQNNNEFSQEDFYRNQQQQQQANPFDLSKLQGSLPFAPSIGPQGNHLESLPHLNQQFNHHHATHQMEAAFRPQQSLPPTAATSTSTQSGWATAFLNKNQIAQDHSPQRMDSPTFNQSNMMNRGMGMNMGMMNGIGMNHQLNLMNQNHNQLYSQMGPSMGMEVDVHDSTRLENRSGIQKGESFLLNREEAKQSRDEISLVCQIGLPQLSQTVYAI